MVKVNTQKNNDTESLIYNQHGERLAILNTENIKICGWITKLVGGYEKMHSVCVVFHVYRKFEFLVSQGSVATCLRWGGHCHRVSLANFIRFSAVQKFWKSVKIRQSYRQLKGGNFFETPCSFALRLCIQYGQPVSVLPFGCGTGILPCHAVQPAAVCSAAAWLMA